MKEGKTDKYLFFISLIAFLFSFFIIGNTPIHESDIPFYYKLDDGRDEIISIEYPVANIMCPLICFMFLFLIIFKEELYPVDRHWVKRKIKESLYKRNR